MVRSTVQTGESNSASDEVSPPLPTESKGSRKGHSGTKSLYMINDRQLHVLDIYGVILEICTYLFSEHEF